MLNAFINCGIATFGPQCGPVSRNIAEPTTDDAVIITANASYVGSTGTVVLNFNTSSSPWTATPMNMASGDITGEATFVGIIPKQALGVIVYYYINASVNTLTDLSATFNYTVTLGSTTIITIVLATVIPIGVLIVGIIYFRAHPEKLSSISKKLRKGKDR